MYEDRTLGETPSWKRGHCSCGKLIDHKADMCRACYVEKKRESLPEKSEFIEVAKTYKCNFSALGRYYGVSDNAIRKWCVAYGLPRKTFALRKVLM